MRLSSSAWTARPMVSTTITFGLLSLLPSVLALDASGWTNRTIYQVLTDRFSLSNDSGPACNATAGLYCGGTWQGIINHLDYIQGMGFDAVWISPVVKNVEVTNTTDGEAYHGYWTQDPNSLNPHFGNQSDLSALSSALHNRGMLLMVDIVVNHFASPTVVPSSFTSGNPPANLSFPQPTLPMDVSAYPAPFNNASAWHPFCLIDDYSNQTDVEQCWLGDLVVPLPDVNTENQDIVNTLYSWITDLVNSTGADGLRIDTVKHVRKDFWPGFAQAAGVYTVGEVLDADPGYVGPYTSVIDGVLDYPTYFVLTQAFTSPTGNISALVSTYQASQSEYKNGLFNTGSFLENQDNPRFGSITQDQGLVKNAITFNFVGDGIPILYYGQEQGYTGGGVPNNREAFWFTEYDTSKPLVGHVTTLNSARRAAGMANNGFWSTKAQFLASTPSTFALSKPPMLALLTNVGANSSSGSPLSWSVPNAGYSKNEALVDVLTCEGVNADSKGGVSMAVNGGMPRVLLPQSALQAANAGQNGSQVLCTSIKQASGSSGAPRQSTRMDAVGLVGSVLAVVGALALL